jgi:cystathionine gamma-synthase
LTHSSPPPADADLVFLEAPSNPYLTMPDFEAAAAHPAPVVCDATLASPLGLRPLEHGCDVGLHSATKILGGHDDLLAGVTVTCDAALTQRLHDAAAGGDRGGRRHGVAARARAEDARRAARPDRGDRARARRAPRGTPRGRGRPLPSFGFLASFDVADAEYAGRVERAVTAIQNATGLGSTTTKLESRLRWEGDRIPPGLMRLSVGLEDVELLWADLEQALTRA